MAQFYASVRGQATTHASRLGTKGSGITTSTKSYAGEVNVHMYHVLPSNRPGDEARDWVRVTLCPHASALDNGTAIVLYDGPCDGWREYHKMDLLTRMAWDAAHRRIKWVSVINPAKEKVDA